MRNSTPLQHTDKGSAGSAQRLPQQRKKSWSQIWLDSIKRYYWLYIFIMPTLVYFLLFHYGPMGGLVIAFKRYTGALSIWESKWVGLKWFRSFFKSPYAGRTIINSIVISFYNLSTFPLSIILALVFDEVRSKRYKRVAQTVMYAPHFISTVVLVSMLSLFFNSEIGFVNKLIEAFGGEAHNFMTDPKAFRHLYVWSGVWQNLGWNCVIYVSALSAVDPSLQEAARLDGASRLQQIRHIKLPTILPTIIIMLIMRVGHIMNVGADKVLLMKNNLNSATAETISTFVYERGLLDMGYSYGAAVGLFENVVNFSMLLIVNKISAKVSETSLF